MKVRLRDPDREVQLGGGLPVSAVLDEFGIAVDTVLIIQAGELITREAAQDLADEVLPAEIYDRAGR